MQCSEVRSECLHVSLIVSVPEFPKRSWDGLRRAQQGGSIPRDVHELPGFDQAVTMGDVLRVIQEVEISNVWLMKLVESARIRMAGVDRRRGKYLAVAYCKSQHVPLS